jgi:hypothetical protein
LFPFRARVRRFGLTVVGNDASGTTGITEVQRQAVEAAMNLILEEDRERGIGPDERFRCSGCAIDREAAGAVMYEGVRLCNACATGFEVERMSGTVRSSAEYVRRRTKRPA